MTRRDALAGLALANILLIRSWFLAGTYAYLGSGLPMTRARAGLIALWLLLAAALALLSAWSRKGPWPFRITAWTYALLLLLPADWVLRNAAGIALPLITDRAGVAVGMVAALLLSVTLVQRVLVRIVPLALLPIVLVTVGYAALPMFARPVEASPLRQPERQTSPDGARVLWLLFDELDYRLIAGERENAPTLPAFKALMSEAFVATQATSPERKTLSAIPSIFTGRHVRTATPSGRDLILRFDEGGGRWATQASPFTRVREKNFWTGIVGWYHPYCDALPGQFDWCEWTPFTTERHQSASIVEATLKQAQEAAGAFSLLFRNNLDQTLQTQAQLEQARHEHFDVWRRADARGKALALAQRPGLAMIHYPVPHAPGILQLVSPAESWTGYLGNAVLADRTLAALRADLEASGRWTDTVIVVSADHAWRTARPSDPRVPLIIKLPGAAAHATYDHEISLMVLHDLLPRLVQREIATTDQLGVYLSRAAASATSNR
ncbi:MAG: sulfatase-like hydrolase/transferase [Acidobacteriota bacterium]|nr:sulfatase-like hydrolase/transferase [Acidobacteriota bacterium]